MRVVGTLLGKDDLNYAVAISKTVQHLFSITQSLDGFCLTRLSDMVAAELQQLFR